MAEQKLDLLNEPFPRDIIEQKGGFDYIPHPYVTERLNMALGVGAWSFRVLETTWAKEVDEVLVHGELTAVIAGERVVKEQWGGQKINKNRDGKIVELANDFKGAASDALKKCATLLGVGEELYMQGHKPPKQEPKTTGAPQSATSNTSHTSPVDKPKSNLPPPQANKPQGENKPVPTDKQLYELATLADVNLKEAVKKKWGKEVKDLGDEEKRQVANGLLGSRIGKKAAQKLHIAGSQAGWSEDDLKAMLKCTDSLTEVKVIDYEAAMEKVSQPKTGQGD